MKQPLSIERPDLVLQWHPTKNGSRTPNQVTAGSGVKVWWVCEKGPDHEWEAAPEVRTRSGCPFCAGKRVSITNSLGHNRPDIARRWHPEKNGGLRPDQVTFGSAKKVWWRCEKGSDHEWKAAPSSRIVKVGGCPFCAGRSASVTNSLAGLHPDLANEWHPTKNEPVSPDQVVAGTHRKVWWRCPKDPEHAWEATIGQRLRMSACPICNSLALTFPAIAAQWHPTKNGNLTAAQITAGSGIKVWWQCGKGPDHEWPAPPAQRTRRNESCPFCSGKRVSVTNSFQTLRPDLASQWHPTLNGDLTPARVTLGSNKKVWWKCENGPDHVWQLSPYQRDKNKGTCPACSNRQLSVTNRLSTVAPDLAAQWHPTFNGGLTPDMVVSGVFWWKCAKGPDHEWKAPVFRRLKGGGCPACANQQLSVSNSLAQIAPELAAEWHPTRNADLSPADIIAGGHTPFWWKCDVGDDHEWRAPVSSRKAGVGCPMCAGKKVSVTNSLASLAPAAAAQWHPTKNGLLTPDSVVGGSTKRCWWKCDQGSDHEWQSEVRSRVRMGSGCPACQGLRVSVTNSLATLEPELAAEWHPTRNGQTTPEDIVAKTEKYFWWRCRKDSTHEWSATPSNRGRGRGCPYCNMGWTVDNIRQFVKSIESHLSSFTSAELFGLYQRNGLVGLGGRGKSFVAALATGRFPQEELTKFVRGEPSLVDDFVEEPGLTLEQIESSGDGALDEPPSGQADVDAEFELPTVSTRQALAALDHVVVTTGDEDAVEFFVASAIAKIWKHAFRDEAEAVSEARAFAGDEYSERVRTHFLGEYDASKALEIPEGYSFTAGGDEIAPPLLMQRLVSVRVRDNRRIGNWSGTGAGKTLSAILASRVINAGLTVICCPNSVVEGWAEAIKEIFPDSLVATKNFSPSWAGHEATGFEKPSSNHRYLVLNYEAFQQRNSSSQVKTLVASEQIDFIVVDEIHFTKQRQADNVSLRKKMIGAMIAMAAERNDELAVLGMSATPVINNLYEGKSLVEMITGIEHNDLLTASTVANCMSLHQRLTTLGIRWKPDYHQTCNVQKIDVDCSEYLDDIRDLGRTHSPLDLEKLLTQARLPVILESVRPKTLIYTNYVSDIDRELRDALEAAGWTTGFYTGEDKAGKEGFLKGDIDVLIGSSAIGTGVDGLQRVCNRLIINVLPWTHAEYEQLLGRIHRQGQVKDTVDVIIPVTYATVEGERWSWCDSKLQRIQFKKSVADAAVDGIVPEQHLRTPAQAYRDVLGWLERLDRGESAVIKRRKIDVPLPDDDEGEVERRLANYGAFSKMNYRWNTSKSTTTNERLQANPEEWEQYHTLYRKARETWTATPFEEIISWCNKREGYAIGDFGCGEAQLASALADRHTVHSFDHVAINDSVVACDMAHTALEDSVLDVAVFSLSLMGANVTDYLMEAHRTLKIDGQLHIVEATSRFADRDAFAASLGGLGFDVISVKDLWKFTYIRAIKADRRVDEKVRLRFSATPETQNVPG